MNIKVEKEIQTTLELWKRVWGESLHSVYLYGSYVRGNWNEKTSDVNMILIVDDKSYDKWPEAAEIVKRKSKKGFSTPVFMTKHYIDTSIDVFPMEFMDMKLFHKTLYGEDYLDSIEISKKHLRLQAEREVKSKWLQLRQAAMEISGNTPGMRELLILSVPTWVSVFQALHVMNGVEIPEDKRDVIRKGAEIAGLDEGLFLKLMDLRQNRSAANRNEAWTLLKNTLEQVDILAEFVDSWNMQD